MAGTTTLQSIQQQQKKERVTKGFLGGTFENLGDIFNTATATITGLGEGYVNEGPVSRQDLEQTESRQQVKRGGLPINGELTGFQTPRMDPEARKQQIQAELANAQQLTEVQKPVEERRVEINELNQLQVLFQGSVDEEGNVTVYHQANANKKQVENLALQLQTERAKALAELRKTPATPTSAAVGPTINLNTAFEDQKPNRPG